MAKLILRCPELNELGSEIERRDALRIARKRAERLPIMWCIMTVGGAALVLPPIVRRSVGATVGPYWDILVELGPALAIVVAMVWAYQALWRRELRKYLVLDRGVPICLKCGYNLRDATSATCPECGTRISEEAKALIGQPARENVETT